MGNVALINGSCPPAPPRALRRHGENPVALADYGQVPHPPGQLRLGVQYRLQLRALAVEAASLELRAQCGGKRGVNSHLAGELAAVDLVPMVNGQPDGLGSDAV